MDAIPLSCSECGAVGTYRRGVVLGSDVVCTVCGNEVNFVDFDPDEGETIAFDIFGVLCVYTEEVIEP